MHPAIKSAASIVRFAGLQLLVSGLRLPLSSCRRSRPGTLKNPNEPGMGSFFGALVPGRVCRTIDSDDSLMDEAPCPTRSLINALLLSHAFEL